MVRSSARRDAGQAQQNDLSHDIPKKVRPFDPAPAIILSHTLLDTLMPVCDPYEWKIVCAVLRHQHERKLSVGKLMRWTGMANRQTCFDSLTRCLKKGYIVRVPVGNSFAYKPNLDLELPIPDEVI